MRYTGFYRTLAVTLFFLVLCSSVIFVVDIKNMKKNTSIILGFDFGMKYIGVAVGQQISNTATPITCLSAKDGIPNWVELVALVREWQPGQLIVGVPLSMDGTAQQLTYCAQKFANRLQQQTALPVSTVDERLSTWEAKNRFLATTKRGKCNYNKLNAMAAAVLVEQWLNDRTE